MSHFIVYCQPGSPSFKFIPPDVWGRGVGGAELSLISLAETLIARGHTVTVYNDPPQEGEWAGVKYRHADKCSFNRPFDVFIVYRNSFPELRFVRARKKVFFTTDQMTTGDYETAIYPFVDFAIGISEFHKQDHIKRYHIAPDRFIAIDLGVRLEDYVQTAVKVPGKLLYCSVPHRGAPYLPNIFAIVRDAVPHATLTLTSDYTLWGPGIPAGTNDIRTLFAHRAGISFLGAVSRQELIRHQLEAELLVYPHFPVNGLPELFGVSVAECQVAGCLPIVTDWGALPTTLVAGRVVHGDARTQKTQEDFAQTVITYLCDLPHLRAEQELARARARARFDWQRIAALWEQALT